MPWIFRRQRALEEVIEAQDDLIAAHLALIENLQGQLLQQELNNARYATQVLAGFLVFLDKPEDHDELRDVLHSALIDMSDETARLEEHCV